MSDSSMHGSALKPMSAARSRGLTGRLRVPGDKSISHRSLLIGAMTVGRTEITGLLEGEDVIATAKAVRAMGATVERHDGGNWSVNGLGVGTLLPPRDALDFGNAGTGSRLAMGVVAGHPFEAVFDGDASLRKRPMRRILDPLMQMGAETVEQAEGGRLPLRLRGAREVIPITYETPVASAQIKSAVLLCGLCADGETTVIEKEATRDHTERMLAHFGAKISSEQHGEHGRKVRLRGRPELKPQKIVVPADISSAAFPMVAALIVPGSDIVLENVLLNPLRAGLVETLREMGANIEELNRRDEAGEIIADLRVRTSSLKGVDVPAARAPSMIDEYIVLAVAASFAKGDTRMRGLSELRVKESDRLAATADGLRANGVDCETLGDDLLVGGRGHAAPGGGVVKTHMDHRLAMAFLMMGLASDKPVQVDDGTFIATSFPDFTGNMRRLGAEIS
ncbi:MAG: 3-phosphoshikimate 1-carboxyvinyltransferase [Xanthobacteraceae bacterium]|nr:3-phosphoshikimate 1-carboxyvinyltransferase [Xanthobacteraceae bacterium]QYK45061.1 MAG: 3-phosphoshikimate 1-carboxyvinyltransferase [Xanthobacteraceae bacterium]